MMLKQSFKCMCGKTTQLDIDSARLSRVQAGEHVQHVFPDASPFFREVIISGTCYDCQQKLFNRPAPGHEKEWGAFIGSCPCCDRAIYEKDVKDGKYTCTACGESVEVKDGKIVEVDIEEQ